MLTDIVVTNNQGSLLSLVLEEISSGITVQNIEGLGPVKATLVSTSFAMSDGGQFLSARREERNIVFTLGMEPDYILEEVSDVRSRIYDFFMTKAEVDLEFNHSNGFGPTIHGVVESCEPAIFSNEPAMVISIMCYDPDFLGDEVEFTGSTVSDTTDTPIEYLGKVETGILFEIDIDRDLDEFTLYNTMPNGQTRTLYFAWPLHADDVVTINSVPGQKLITLTRGGGQSSLLYAMSPQSSWIDLYPGINTFRAYAEGAAIPYKISYLTRYGGL